MARPEIVEIATAFGLAASGGAWTEDEAERVARAFEVCISDHQERGLL